MVTPLVDPTLGQLNALPGFPTKPSPAFPNNFALGTYLNLLAAGVNAAALTGNVLWVDAVNGVNATAVRGDLSHPFLTVEAAIAVALSGDLIMVLPGTHTLAADVTIPAGVVLRGLSRKNTTLARLLVTANATLITMGENSSIVGLSLRLTSAGHFTLKGVVFAGTTTETALLENLAINVDNSGASDLGTSAVTGIHVTATSTPTSRDRLAIDDVICRVDSAGLGTKRAVLLDTSTSNMRMQASTFTCLRTGAGAGSYIGSEVNRVGAILNLQSVAVEGFTADMSQTAGSLEVTAVDLANDNANGLSFTVVQSVPRFTWGVAGALPNGVTRFLYPGTQAESVNEIFTRMATKGIIKSLTVRARVAPGGVVVDTFTLRKNGVNTALSVSLVGAALTAASANVSVSFLATDDLSISAATGVGSATNDLVIVAELY